MLVNSFDCFLLVKDALGLLFLAVIDILNGGVLPCSFAASCAYFLLPFTLLNKAFATVVCLLVVFGLCPISSLTLGVYLSALFWSLIRPGVNEG